MIVPGCITARNAHASFSVSSGRSVAIDKITIYDNDINILLRMRRRHTAYKDS